MLNFDNDKSRNVVDLCYRTTKTLVNPIIDWTDEEVWGYLNDKGIKHCCLYDEGFKRIGCIGCPMSTKAAEELERWPKYKAMYIKAFERMIDNRQEKELESDWKTPEEVMDWWLRK